MPKKNSKLKISPRTLVTGGIIVVVLLVAVGAGVLTQSLQRQAEQNSGPDPFTIAGGPPLPNAVEEAQDLASSGKTDEANKKIEEALAKNPSSDTSYELYIQHGINLQNAGDNAGAIEQYRKAEAIKQDFKITRLIAQWGEVTGDKALALEYYKKALPLLDPEGTLYASEKARLETKIKELGG